MLAESSTKLEWIQMRCFLWAFKNKIYSSVVYQLIFLMCLTYSDSCCNETLFNVFIYKTIATKIHEISWFSDCHLPSHMRLNHSRLNKTPASKYILPEVSLISITQSASWPQRWEDRWWIRNICDTDSELT